jgi:hypothetical protein
MENGFYVRLQALIQNATNLDAASEHLDAVVAIASSGAAAAAANALGVIGRAADFPEKYNKARATVAERAATGSEAFRAGALELLRAEQRYAANDKWYAKKFGVMDDGTRPTVPNLGQPKTATLPPSK